MANTLDQWPTSATVIGDTDLMPIKVGTGTNSDKKITGANVKAMFATAAQGSTADSASQPGHTHTESEITDLGTYLVSADIDTLAELNAIVADATLIDTGDSRLSDDRTPTSHTHTESEITDLGTYSVVGHTHEGTAILSTGVSVGWVLQADGDNSSSWVALAGGGDALTANPLSQFAATTSAQLLGVISDETGSGALVFADTPTLVTPVLGTPTSGTLTNCDGTAASLVAGTVSSIGNLTGHITSTNRATLLGSFTLAQLNTAVSDATLVDFERRGIAFSDETSDLTTGDNKATFHMPNYATTLLEVSVGMTDAPTDAAAIFDLTEAGTTVLSTLITIDAGEKTSEDAATPPVISDSSLAANALMSVNVDQVGSTLTGKGGKLYLKYRRA